MGEVDGGRRQAEVGRDRDLARGLGLLVGKARVAALGTVDARSPGMPSVTMAPFALAKKPDGAGAWIVLRVSSLATHAGNVRANPRVCLMINAQEWHQGPAMEMARVSIEGVARDPASQEQEDVARAAYLAKFPEAAVLEYLGDFRWLLVDIWSARHVAGLGAASSVDADALGSILRSAADMDEEPALSQKT